MNKLNIIQTINKQQVTKIINHTMSPLLVSFVLLVLRYTFLQIGFDLNFNRYSYQIYPLTNY